MLAFFLTFLEVIWIAAMGISSIIIALDVATAVDEHRNQDKASVRMKKAALIFVIGLTCKVLKHLA